MLLVAIATSALAFSWCKKSSPEGCGYSESTLVAPASEVATLQAYITANHPTAIQHPSGLFYEITAPGSGANPSICSKVTVKYSGYLTTGAKFDENLTGVTFSLGDLIVGWQKGLPLVKKSGSITLYIPPSLGYGNRPVGSIPANSYLVFYIQLVDVQ